MTWGCVVPTCRPAEFDRFVKAWEPLFHEHDVTLYPVRDEPASWEKWPDWVPRRSAACNSYGMWQAWRDGHGLTLMLDDDVRPGGIGGDDSGETPGYEVDIFAEYEAAFERTWPCSTYLDLGSIIGSTHPLRGFPQAGRDARCMVQYGGWHGVLDYSGVDQLKGIPGHETFTDMVFPVPRGTGITTCGMNVAWRTEFTPCMWQLPMFEGRYARMGDLWSGLIQKRILDARGEVVLINGRASVLHERASDPVKNAELEAPGMPLNEDVWNMLPEDVAEFESVATELGFFFEYTDIEYAGHYFTCLDQWVALFR